MTKKQKHSRSPESVQISISLPAKLLHAIDKLAKQVQRPRSNLIAYVLTKEVDNAGIAANDADKSASK